ncbi:MAG TPA: hypothetical protein VK789_31630 [Bryobacteraceae bacterium]|jgi:hypothetical protein|nr:hypothetical protein [Bryobacteraceae bacterium]
MCDYSLMMIDNRLAVEGEHLVAHRFKSGSVGLVSMLDFTKWQLRPRGGFWQRCKECFSSRSEPAPVVCIPPGARLRVQAIPQTLRDRFGLDGNEDATFTQISADVNWHRDALLFSNKATVLLQALPEGQALKVLGLASSEASEPVPAHVRFVPAA